MNYFFYPLAYNKYHNRFCLYYFISKKYQKLLKRKYKNKLNLKKPLLIEFRFYNMNNQKDKKKIKGPCCVCKDTKKIRDECIMNLDES